MGRASLVPGGGRLVRQARGQGAASLSAEGVRKTHLGKPLGMHACGCPGDVRTRAQAASGIKRASGARCSQCPPAGSFDSGTVHVAHTSSPEDRSPVSLARRFPRQQTRAILFSPARTPFVCLAKWLQLAGIRRRAADACAGFIPCVPTTLKPGLQRDSRASPMDCLDIATLLKGGGFALDAQDPGRMSSGGFTQCAKHRLHRAWPETVRLVEKKIEQRRHRMQ